MRKFIYKKFKKKWDEYNELSNHPELSKLVETDTKFICEMPGMSSSYMHFIVKYKSIYVILVNYSDYLDEHYECVVSRISFINTMIIKYFTPRFYK